MPHMEDRGRALHLTANLFAAAFGIAGLAQAWSTVLRLANAPDRQGKALWVIAALVAPAGSRGSA